MTREEAIDELHKHYVPEYVNYIVTALTDGATPSDAPTINAIPIPENATNGDVIKAVFPNTNIEYWAEYSTYNVEFPNDNDVKHFSYDWWNAKYKGGGMMQIVIEIHEKIYEKLAVKQEENIPWDYIEKIITAITYGIPLPKLHGRLIDADVLADGFEDNYEFCEVVNATPTIIKADKENEDASSD